MTDFQDIRKGLATVIKSQISGLRVYEYEPTFAARLEYPCLIISQFGDIPYLPVLQAGGFQTTLICFLRVESTDREEAGKALDLYRWPNGDKSLFAAVNTDNTLEGSVNHAYVMNSSQPERDPDRIDRMNEWQTIFTLQVIHAVN